MSEQWKCPECGTELVWDDYFGRYLGDGNWDKKGDIYVCPNEECEEHFFWTHINDPVLYRGYPC